jgi:lipid-A-disaccharide synthase-like uncharacterized protein
MYTFHKPFSPLQWGRLEAFAYEVRPVILWTAVIFGGITALSHFMDFLMNWGAI